MLVNYHELIKENRKYAFTCYVRDWKKQDPNTIEIDGDIYSYRTRRGVKHSFRATKNVTALKVQGFYFEKL